MRRARVIGTMALVASMSVVPMAVAAGGHNGNHHHPPAPVHYYASGAAAAVVCTTPGTVGLTNTQFKPSSIGTNGSAFSAATNSLTKFAGRKGHAIGCGQIKTNDRVMVVWTEPAGTPFVATLPATRVVDMSRR